MRIILAALVICMGSLSGYAADKVQGRQQSPCDGSGGWGMDCVYNKIFVIKSVTQIAGEVIAVESFVPQAQMTEGALVKVKTGKDVTAVHLGPRWFLDNQDIQIKPTDSIDIKGSRVLFNGTSVMIASEVIKGDQVLRLRDEQGRPLWSAWKLKGKP
jgi:hypothetical protein